MSLPKLFYIKDCLDLVCDVNFGWISRWNATWRETGHVIWFWYWNPPIPMPLTSEVSIILIMCWRNTFAFDILCSTNNTVPHQYYNQHH